MKVLVLANDEQKKEWLTIAPKDGTELIWSDGTNLPATIQADAIVDLLFENDPQNVQQRIEWLKQQNASLIVVNAVITTLQTTGSNFIRINGWNSFLQRSIVEASGTESSKKKAEQLFSNVGRSIEWVPDIPGFISARVVVMIINEAFLAMEENVSVEKEIDVAMKLGTNYPYGPFEWGEKIGFDKVVALLQVLEVQKIRYKPSSLLREKLLV